MPIPARRARVRPASAVQVEFLIFGVIIAGFFPFIGLFLDARGLTKGEIGVVFSLQAAARMLVAPVWGHLADTRLGRQRTLILSVAGWGFGALLLWWWGNGFATAAATGAVLAGLSVGAGPAIDSLALELLGKANLTGYGRIRAWESLSYALASLVIGAVLEAAGVEWAMPICAVASFVAAAWAVPTIERDSPKRKDEHGRFGAVGAVFRESPRFAAFLGGIFLLWMGFSAAWNFIGLRIESKGGGPFLVGVGAFLGGLVEVVVMRSSSRLQRRFGLRTVYVMGCGVYAAGFLLWSVADNATVLSVLTTLEGFGFALLFTTGIVIIGKLVPSSLYATGNSVATTVGFGIAPIFANLVGGYVWERFGSGALYLGSSALAVIASFLVWNALSAPAFTRAGAIEAVAEQPVVAPPLGEQEPPLL